MVEYLYILRYSKRSKNLFLFFQVCYILSMLIEHLGYINIKFIYLHLSRDAEVPNIKNTTIIDIDINPYYKSISKTH